MLNRSRHKYPLHKFSCGLFRDTGTRNTAMPYILYKSRERNAIVRKKRGRDDPAFLGGMGFGLSRWDLECHPTYPPQCPKYETVDEEQVSHVLGIFHRCGGNWYFFKVFRRLTGPLADPCPSFSPFRLRPSFLASPSFGSFVKGRTEVKQSSAVRCGTAIKSRPSFFEHIPISSFSEFRIERPQIEVIKHSWQT